MLSRAVLSRATFAVSDGHLRARSVAVSGGANHTGRRWWAGGGTGVLQVNPGGLRAAKKTVEQAVTRVRQLYEQGADLVRIGEYVRTWRRWLTSGLSLLSDSWDDPGPATWI